VARPYKRRLGDLFLELGEEVEGVEGGEVVQVGGAELVENGAVEGSEENFLVAGAAWGLHGCGLGEDASRCAGLRGRG